MCVCVCVCVQLVDCNIDDYSSSIVVVEFYNASLRSNHHDDERNVSRARTDQTRMRT
jgi:hypothetical protein